MRPHVCVPCVLVPQLGFATEWGSLLETNAPAATLEEDIAWKKAELAACVIGSGRGRVMSRRSPAKTN